MYPFDEQSKKITFNPHPVTGTAGDRRGAAG
jgi:hypothetical protein